MTDRRDIYTLDHLLNRDETGGQGEKAAGHLSTSGKPAQDIVPRPYKLAYRVCLASKCPINSFLSPPGDLIRRFTLKCICLQIPVLMTIAETHVVGSIHAPSSSYQSISTALPMMLLHA